MQAKNFANSLLILLPFALVSLATSKASDYSPTPLNYNLASDCANATVISGPVTVTDGEVTSPANTTFLDFGLPVAKFSIATENPVSAEIAPALTRSCIYTLITTPNVVKTYTCSDNGIYSCTVTLTRTE
jgi:hypothetical protein